MSWMGFRRGGLEDSRRVAGVMGDDRVDVVGHRYDSVRVGAHECRRGGIARKLAGTLTVLVAGALGCRPPCVEHPWQSRFVGTNASSDKVAKLKLQGCGPVFEYWSGGKGFFGGTGSFCTDSPYNQAILKANHMYGFPPGYCETCMGVPDGKVFVFWGDRAGPAPSCSSGCPNAADVHVHTPPDF
jgi:hypothetical protein